MTTSIRFTVFASALAIGLLGLKNVSEAGKPPLPPPFPAMPIDYQVSWLRAPSGATNTWATGSNDSGTVAGYYANANGQNRACIWTLAGVRDLNDLVIVPDGWVLKTARAINNSGQIAGSAMRLSDGLIRVYRYDPPTDVTFAQVTLMGNLNSSVSHDITYVRPLNSFGDVSYHMFLADGKHTYVQTTTGSVFELPGYSFNSISDSRQLVGGNIRWTVSSGLVEIFSSTLAGTDVNVYGNFAGRMNDGRRGSGAVRYQSGAQVIGPGHAYGINASKDVVGYDSNTGAGFIFTDTYGYVDLDTLVTATSSKDQALWFSSTSIQPWKITDRDAFGSFGEISGTAFFSGSVNLAFVLTPIPAP